EVVVDGSSTVYPISEAAADAFRSDYPNVSITVGKGGTGAGFKRFSRGETDISDASRPIKDSEFKLCQEHGVSFIELPVAYDGLSIVVNPKNNWVDHLTIDELKQIFLEERAAKTWAEVRASWPDVRISLHIPGTDSGTFDYFKEIVAPEDKATGDTPALRSDMSTSEEDNDLVRGVAGEEGALGFFGASYYFNNREKVKVVPIVDPQTGEAVTPSPETIESGEYAPFSRPLFIYVNVDSLKRPEVSRFVQFYLENAADFAEQVDYVALPDELYDAADEHLQERWTGAHFLTADLGKRTGSLSEVYKKENRVETTSK
ncbi:MAG: PstS family phosphate ABC transporter substrate-binding protein, partial [Planctomycetes bacterium]|nr:PstS family phosphate ABC transporter substrate-binding protein [Planctomycetota bacterium]